MSIAALILVTVVASPGAATADRCAQLFAEAERIAGMRDSDATAGVAAARAGLDRATAFGCVEARAEMYAALGDNLNVVGRRDASFDAYRRAADILGPLGDSVQLAAVLRREGITHASAGDYSSAVERVLESYRISVALGDRNEAAMSAGNLGTLYSRLFEFERARTYFERAHADFVALGNRVSAAGTGINLGSLLMREADRTGDAARVRALREDALRHNLDAVAQFEAIDHPRGLSMALSNAGVALNLLGRHEEALPLHRRSQGIRERVGDRDGLTATHIHLAQTFIPLGRHADAERHLTTATELAADRNPTLRLGVAEKWVELEEARGRAGEALARLREVNRIRAEMTAADHQARVAEIQARYDVAEQARQLDALRYEREIDELTLQRQRAWLVGGIVLIASLMLALGGMVAWQRMRAGHARALEYVSRNDALTGLANRYGMIDRLEYEIRRSRRSGRPFALVAIDVDGIAEIHEGHGQEAADRVFADVAQRLDRRVRRQDTLARWRRDGLLLLLPETDEAGAAVLERKLAAAVGENEAVGLMMGAAQYWPGQELDDVVRAADHELERRRKAAEKPRAGEMDDEAVSGIPNP